MKKETAEELARKVIPTKVGKAKQEAYKDVLKKGGKK